MTETETRNRLREQPSFAYNHPKNYLGVPVAVAAEGSTGALVSAFVVRGAGAAKRGARQFDLIDEEGALTPLGEQVVDVATEKYGSPTETLHRLEELRGSSTRFCTVDDGAWADVTARVVSRHPAAGEIIDIIDESGPLRLPELAHHYLARSPETARRVIVRGNVDLPDGDSEAADELYKPGTYHSPIICQLKTILYHAGIITERGRDSAHLIPETDVWELEENVEDILTGGVR